MNEISWTLEAWSDYLFWQTQDRKTLKRINSLIKDTLRTPFDGIGKPEPLKGRAARMPYRSAGLEPGRCKALVRRGRVIPASSDDNAADVRLKARPAGLGESPVLGVAMS